MLIELNHAEGIGPKSIQLTHNDLDGQTCAILVSQLYDNKPVFTSYRKILENANLLLEIAANTDVKIVFITDLHLNLPELIDIVNTIALTKKVVIIDHHTSIPDGLLNRNISYYFDKQRCATQITFDLLSSSNNNPKLLRYETMVSEVNAFDLWNTKSQHFKNGILMNDFLWSNNRPTRFFTKWVNQPFDFDDHNTQQELQIISEKRIKHFNHIENHKYVIEAQDFLFTYSDDYLHHIQLKYPGFKYYINLTSYQNLSLKVSEGVKFNCIPQFKEFISENKLVVNNQGGHDLILSVQFVEETMYLIDTVIKFIKGFYGKR